MTTRERVLAAEPFVKDGKRLEEAEVRVALDDMELRKERTYSDLCIVAAALCLEILDGRGAAEQALAFADVSGLVATAIEALPKVRQVDLDRYLNAAAVGSSEHVAFSPSDGWAQMALDLLLAADQGSLQKLSRVCDNSEVVARWASTYDFQDRETRDGVLKALLNGGRSAQLQVATQIVMEEVRTAIVRKQVPKLRLKRADVDVGTQIRMVACVYIALTDLPDRQPWMRQTRMLRAIVYRIEQHLRRLLITSANVDVFLGGVAGKALRLSAAALSCSASGADEKAHKAAEDAFCAPFRSINHALTGPYIGDSDMRDLARITELLPLRTSLYKRLRAQLGADYLCYLVSSSAYNNDRSRLIKLSIVAGPATKKNPELRMAIEETAKLLRGMPHSPTAAVASNFLIEEPELQNASLPWS